MKEGGGGGGGVLLWSAEWGPDRAKSCPTPSFAHLLMCCGRTELNRARVAASDAAAARARELAWEAVFCGPDPSQAPPAPFAGSGCSAAGAAPAPPPPPPPPPPLSPPAAVSAFSTAAGAGAAAAVAATMGTGVSLAARMAVRATQSKTLRPTGKKRCSNPTVGTGSVVSLTPPPPSPPSPLFAWRSCEHGGRVGKAPRR